MKALCEAFDVHSSSYAYWVNETRCKPVISDELVVAVKQAFELSDSSADVRTVAQIVTAEGKIDLTRFMASKAMKHLGLVSKPPPRHNYRKAEKPHLDIENSLNREFDVSLYCDNESAFSRMSQPQILVSSFAIR